METMENSPQRREYQRDEHRVHLVLYHLIWCPRRRKSVLIDAIAKRCREVIEGVCKEKGWKILDLEVRPDHLHLQVRVWPSDSPAGVVKELKRATAFQLGQEF